jgi:Flp pilus assembly protein TadG
MIMKFLRNIRGNFAISFSILSVPLMGAAGLAVDYSSMHLAKSHLQDVADAAALAAAKELALSTISKTEVVGVVDNYVAADFNTQKIASEYVKVLTTLADDRSEVTVDLAYYWQPFFAHYVNSDVLPIRVSAKARQAGSEPMCVLATKPDGKDALNMRGSGLINASRCSVHANSTDPSAVNVSRRATINASNIYSSGGYVGDIASFKPQPIVDSPTAEDPLADRVAPTAGTCDYTNYVPWDWNNYLKPGTYCGGITSSGNVNIDLQPGVYIFKDGPLSLNGKGTLTADGVTLVFEGEKAVLDIGPSMTLSLKAARSGATAGILIFEDRSARTGRTFTIRSMNAEEMEGVIYLPNGKLFVDKASRVGQASKWSAIIAREIEIGDGPQIQINTDYGNSNVPVPEGIKGTSSNVYLTN